MNKTVKKIWNAVTTLLVTLVVLLALLLVGVRALGLQVFTVQSGSMEPDYQTGSLIYVKEVDYRGLKEGDVITFMLDENTVATHRIVQVIQDETDPGVRRYSTKGDANTSEDTGLVHYKNILGTPVFTIPKLGYAANFIQDPPGSYLILLGGGLLFFLDILPDLLEKRRPSKQTKGGKYLRK